MSSVKNLRQAVMPIVWLNCIFCMGIFEIPINRKRYYLSAFYVISLLSGYIILFYKGIHIFQESFIQEFMIFYVTLGVNIFVAFLAIILFWWKPENINNIIKKNNIVDNTLNTLGIKTEYQKCSRNILYLMIIWIVDTISLLIIYAIWSYDTIEFWAILYNTACACFPMIINSVVDITFTSFIKCIEAQFQKINILINNVVHCANKSNAFKIHNRHDNTSAFIMAKYKNRKDKIIHLIQTLRQLHLEITRIGRQINHTYCLLILLELAVHFTTVTATTYCVYGAFFGQLKAKITNSKIIVMTITACKSLLKITLINWLCTSVSTEAHKTTEIIQCFEGSVIDDDMREEIHQFTQQVVLNPAKISAAGFFPLNNFLTGKFFATVTTYVVILIQMNTPLWM